MNIVDRYNQFYIENLPMRLTKQLTSITWNRRQSTLPSYSLGSLMPTSHYEREGTIQGRLTFAMSGFHLDDFIDEFVLRKYAVRMFQLQGEIFYIHGLKVLHHTYDHGNSPTWSADFTCNSIEVQRNSLTMEG